MAVVFCGILVTSCVSPPSEQEVASAYYGPEPIAGEQVIKEWFELRLKDSDSAKYLIEPIGKGWYQRSRFTESVFGWRYDAQVNAKNSFGAYTGYNRYLMFLHGDKVTHSFRMP